MRKRKHSDGEVIAWTRALLRLHGVGSLEWPDGTYGLLNVPSKWGGVIADLTTALRGVAGGSGLPVLPDVPAQPAPRKRGKK